MFGFFKKKKAVPTLCKANQGVCVEGQVQFTRGSRTWTEKFNLVSLAAAVLKGRGYSVTTAEKFLEHEDSGFLFSPQLGDMQILEDGGVQTMTTMQTNHPTLAPDGVFEFQHSTGNTIAASISQGFDQWAQVDLVTLLDALRPTPRTCTAMVMEFPAGEGKPKRTRRAVLGPVAHFREKPPASTEPEEHAFCACCLLTNSYEGFKDLIQGDGFCCLRLFAARDQHGTPQADCRVNGEDWTPGAEALRRYVGSWPAAGYEFRKQYVVLQTIQAAG